MWDAQVLLQDLSSKGKIGLTIKAKRNHVLKIQGILLAILALFVDNSENYFIFRHTLNKNPKLFFKQLLRMVHNLGRFSGWWFLCKDRLWYVFEVFWGDLDTQDAWLAGGWRSTFILPRSAVSRKRREFCQMVNFQILAPLGSTHQIAPFCWLIHMD